MYVKRHSGTFSIQKFWNKNEADSFVFNWQSNYD